MEDKYLQEDIEFVIETIVRFLSFQFDVREHWAYCTHDIGYDWQNSRKTCYSYGINHWINRISEQEFEVIFSQTKVELLNKMSSFRKIK
jgi:hypothetical protein